MMLAHQCSARAYLGILVGVVLTVFLLTANRLHSGSPAALTHLTESWTNKPHDNQQVAQSPGSSRIPDATSGNDAPSPNADKTFCDQELGYLRRRDLDLTDNVIYTRRCIKPDYGNVDRDVVANVTSPLISGSTTLNLKGDCSKLTPPPCETLTLQVPPAYPQAQDQYGHLLFGVATTYDRLNDSLTVFSSWLSGTGAQLVAVIADADNLSSKSNLRKLETQFRNAGINATLIPPKLKTSLPRLDTPPDAKLGSPAAVEQLHFLLLRDMLELATPHTQWLGVLDDDTFFPALHPLSLTLRQHDHTRPAWLGALADNWVSNKVWGYMAYGGAGVFVSVPLAKQLNPHLEACIRETTIPSGDGLLKDCVYKYSTTKLTLVDHLYQHDIQGDASGFFESGRKTLSIHHWKSWYHAPVDKMAAITGVCGDCFLQRWRFGKDTVLSNGYSIVQYKDGLDKIDLGRMEATFEEADERFDFVYAPFRPKLTPEQKKSYRLVTVDGEAKRGGRFRQVYVHRAPRDGGKKKRAEVFDEVVELVWEM